MFKLISTTNRPTMPDNIITKDSKPVLNTGNFIQLTGQAKTCKTSVLMELTKSLIDGKSRLGFDFTKCPTDKEVVYINTELSAYDLWEFHEKILKEIGSTRDHPNLKFFDAQSMGKDLILQSLKDYFTTGKPFVVLIDGIVDFVEDFNNQRESKNVVDLILSSCKQHSCAMILTLHQNPSTFSTKSRGHLGTFIEQKAKGTLCTFKNKKGFKLKGEKLRSCPDFIINFNWTEAGLELATSPEVNNKSNMLALVNGGSKTELIKEYIKLYSVTKPTAYNLLNELIQENKIVEEKISDRKSNIKLI